MQLPKIDIDNLIGSLQNIKFQTGLSDKVLSDYIGISDRTLNRFIKNKSARFTTIGKIKRFIKKYEEDSKKFTK